MRPGDQALIREALELARISRDAEDVPVGAVVADAAGRVIARGLNVRELDHDPTGHAEIVALRRAATTLGRWRLEDCTLAVTLEPCGMCAGAIGQARIARLVFGAWDEKAGAVGSQWDLLRDRRSLHRPEVVSGVLEAECAQILGQFFQERR